MNDGARRVAQAIHRRLLFFFYRVRNRMSRKSILGDKPVVVSMTSYGVRANLVFAAIESIGFGVDRPRRLILWLDEEELLVNTPVELVRLQRRGLEVRRCANLGPHKKYFPYVTSCFAEPGALVTADDDCFYTRRWLKGLYDAHSETPDSVIGYRVRKVVVDSDGQLRPYTEWGEVNTAEESFSHFSTGVSGVLYPKTVQQALADRGSQFLEVAPRADDLWLHATAVSVGVRTRQVRDRSIDYLELPAAGRTSLYQENVHGGANDRQARLVYTADLLKRIQGDSSLERQ